VIEITDCNQPRNLCSSVVKAFACDHERIKSRREMMTTQVPAPYSGPQFSTLLIVGGEAF
jgi:hypothetical protein